MHSNVIVLGASSIPGKLEARRAALSLRTAASHKTHGIHRQSLALRGVSAWRKSHAIVQASTGGFAQSFRDAKQDADNRLRDVPKAAKNIE